MSKAQSLRNSKTGFYRVSKKKNKKYKKGFLWGYTYPTEDGKRKALFSVSILKLKEKVETAGLPWEIVNEELAKHTIKEDSND